MNQLNRYRKQLVMLADLILYSATFVFLVRIDYYGLQMQISQSVINASLLYVFILTFQFMLHTHESLWRYAEAREFLHLCIASVCGCICMLVVNMVLDHMPLSPLFLIALTVCALMESIFLRLTYRVYRRKCNEDTGLFKGAGKAQNVDSNDDSVRYVAIIGAGYSGAALLTEITRSHSSVYKVWAFFDDDIAKIGTKLRGIPIKGPIEDIPDILKKSPVYDIILAIPSLELDKRRQIVKMCSKLQCKLRILPDTMMVMEHSSKSMFAETREVKIEDLLGRSTVRFERGSLDAFLSGQTVLVTGGGGSIGSEICRQIAGLNLKKLIIFDIFENDAYLLLQSLKQVYGNNLKVIVEIGSIADSRRVDELYNKYKPDVVFHAAAHKHVPLMEINPCEAVKNNIFGTHNLILSSIKYKCKKFVQISTDKAVNPTNIMGATKRYCEMMIKSMADLKDCKTDFAAVRFGNVLGSNGSVIPIFKNQIEKGGPVTITDKRIIRYFMTIPEAAALVLKAGAMANNADIYVLDMGEPVKILELAENLIRLSGFTPYEEIDIIETGLRPGEKLYEELLINDGIHSSTSQNKIFIEHNDEDITIESINEGLALLKKYIDNSDNDRVRELMHMLIPTFKTPQEVNSTVAISKVAEEKETHVQGCTA